MIPLTHCKSLRQCVILSRGSLNNDVFLITWLTRAYWYSSSMVRSTRMIFIYPDSLQLRVFPIHWFVPRHCCSILLTYDWWHLTVAATAFAAYNAAFVIEISKPFLVVVTSRVDFHVDCFPFNDVSLSFCSEFWLSSSRVSLNEIWWLFSSIFLSNLDCFRIQQLAYAGHQGRDLRGLHLQGLHL